MDEDEDFGRGGAFGEGADDVAVREDVGLEFAGFDVEDEDEDGDGGEDVLALVREVVFYEAVLAATVVSSEIRGGGRPSRHRRGNTHPPQSHRFSIRLPMNLMLLCSTSMVAPSRRTSLAT